jgi:TRAP-type uncharacterized transport system substrate-binding protein
MSPGRQLGVAAGLAAAIVVSLVAVAQFLAPNLTYEITEGLKESLSGGRGRTYRIALGVSTGSYYRIGVVLNRYLKERAGYELELVETAGVPENVGALLDPARGIHLALTESSSTEGATSREITSLAAVGRQYFFVVVPNSNPARDVRDLAGPLNPGLREAGHGPTLGERVFEYYGLIASPSNPTGTVPPATVVRPTAGGNRRDFEAGHMTAATRTQFLQSDLIEGMLDNGAYRLVPIRDHEALAQAIPGTVPGVIPAGSFGPGRRIPPEPVPTLAVTSLLIARSDLPGRVARDILEAVYDPRFARDIRQPLNEESGRNVGVVPLHRAAETFYHRNDLVTSDRIGRLTFVAWLIGAAIATTQFASRLRSNERRKRRRRLLAFEMDKLRSIRRRVEDEVDAAEARALLAEADGVLSRAEQDAAADLLEPEGIHALRSLHGICCRALQLRPNAAQSSVSTPL